ncbi:MAG: FtsQ-type POTRA domain-containing protein [Coriobacteriales bacterium]|nr:FtsQ-type POTRA domain-containing protein [Coriobacteriales bacterium]
MSPRDSRWNGNDRRGTKRSKSVVGSKISEISHELGGSRLPRGGIREQDGLKVAEGALPDTTFIGSRGKRATGHSVLRTIAIVSGSLAAILLVVFIVLAILGRTSMFSVTTVQAHDSEHLTAANIVQLANVSQGTTLINVDEAKIEEGVKRNPWVASVNVERVFPDTLVLTVQERVPSSLVAL